MDQMPEKYPVRWVFAAACTGMLFFGIVIISLGSILPLLITKFDLSEVQAGTLASLLPFGIVLGSLLFGPIVDRYSYKYLLIVSSLLIGIGLESIALSDSFFFLEISFFLIGLGGGAINGSTNALVADISPEKKSANLSLLGVFYGIGALAMPSVVGSLSDIFDYEAIFSGFSILAFLPVILFIVIKFPHPKQPQSFPLREGLRLAGNGTLLLLCFILFFQSGVEGLLNNWTSTYLIRDKGINQQNAILLLSILVLSLTLTRLAMAKILRQVRPYHVMIGSIILEMGGSLIIMFADNFAISLVGIILLGIGIASGFPIILGYVGEIFKDLAGTAFSIVFVIALAGNMIINYSMGLVAYRWGMEQFPVMLIIAVLFISLLLYIALSRISGKIKI